jgi:prephenate dehydrogenase
MRNNFEGVEGENKAFEDSGKLFKVAVVGTGRMGIGLSRLLKGHCDLAICSRNDQKAKAAARRLGIKASTMERCAAGCDILIAAIPTGELLSFAKQFSGMMQPGTLFVDISSVKCGVVKPISDLLPQAIEYVSVHPLFASARVRPRNVVCISVRSDLWGPRLEELLSSSGMCVTRSTPEEHDRAMAAIQVLNHFAYLTLKNALKELGYGPSMRPFHTHAFAKTLATMRMMEKNMETILLIQKLNEYAPWAREVFISEAEKLNTELSGK